MPARLDPKIQQEIQALREEFGAAHVNMLLETWRADSPKLFRELLASGGIGEKIRSHSASLQAAKRMREDRYYSYLSESELLEFSGAPLRLRGGD